MYRWHATKRLWTFLIVLMGVLSLSAQEVIDNNNEAIDNSLLPLYGGHRDVSRRGSWDTVLGEEQREFTADKSVREILIMVRGFSQALKNAGISREWDAISDYFTKRGVQVAQWELQRYFTPSQGNLTMRAGLIKRQQDGRWIVPLRLLQEDMEARFTLIVIADEKGWKVDDLVGHPQFRTRERKSFSPYPHFNN